MDDTLTASRQVFIQGMSRISHFWGFPKAMGAIYGVLYLSPSPLSLDDLVQQAGVTKGAVSTNARALERLGMVHKQIVIGERKDFYTAETDFWKIIKNILQEREQAEFDHALNSVKRSLEIIQNRDVDADKADLAMFYAERMQHMLQFFKTLDNFVAMVLALEDLRLGGLRKMLGNSRDQD